MVDHEKYLHTPATICLSLDDDSSMGAHAVSGTSVPPSTIIVAADYSLEPQLSTSSDHTYPEGGWRANLTVAGAFLWPDECVWHVPGVVRRTSTTTAPGRYDFMDRVATAVDVLLLGKYRPSTLPQLYYLEGVVDAVLID
jgi:hypothetical protein